MKTWLKTFLAFVFGASFFATVYFSTVWESMDDLNYDGLVLLAIVKHDAEPEHNPVRLPAPSFLKALYWDRKGRNKLYAQLLISPEMREIARQYIRSGKDNGWPIEPDRASALISDVEAAEREGVKSLN